MKIAIPMPLLATLMASAVYADDTLQALEHGYEHRTPSALTKPRVAQEEPQETVKRGQQKAAACDLNVLATASATVLVDAVKAADTGCLNELYNLKGTAAHDTFVESKMVTIADAMKQASTNYAGDNSNKNLQLISFLRAGYFVQYYNSAAVGSYGDALQTAIRGAFDTFFASSHAFDQTSASGKILSETITAVDSSEENARYANKLATFLDASTSSSFATSEVRAAINSVFTVAFRGHQNDDFQALVKTDNTFFDALYNFEKKWRDSLIGGGNAYLVLNAARETARFLRYDGDLKTKARERTKEMLDAAPASGNTLSLWAALADMADYFDAANCSYFATCEWEKTLANAVLPVAHTCSPTIRVRAQQMTTEQLSDTCAKLTVQETYFHQRLETNGTPIPGDLNDDLELVVFDSSGDYKNYAGSLFGINTDNGGIYLEGNPTKADNQARFIAYERTWKLSGETTLPFAIWNLEHEYVHYLDGRFDMKGGFSEGQKAKTVWWGEGLAQYIALKNNYPNAYDLAKSASPLALSTIFQNDYNSGSERVYAWGYLATRFMFEKHMSDVRSILVHFRAGDYTGAYTTFMNGLSNTYDDEFKTWLGSLSSGGSASAPQVNAGVDQTVLSAVTVKLNGSATDSDSTKLTYLWKQTKGTSVVLTDANKVTASFVAPSVTQALDLEFELSVSDDSGLSGKDSITIRVEKAGMAPQVNAGADQSVEFNTWVTLNGSATDADGGTLRYQWTQTAGPTVSLENSAMANTRFNAPSVTADTTLEFELQVTDAGGLQGQDKVNVRIKKASAGQAPFADAGNDQSVQSAATVMLTGHASDADSSALTYRWAQTKGTSVTLNGTDTANASFVAPTVTADSELEFQLTVSDGALSDQDIVLVKVQKVGSGSSNGGNTSSGGGGSVEMPLLLLALLAVAGRQAPRKVIG